MPAAISGRSRPATVEQRLRLLVEASKAVLSILETDRLLEVLMDRAIEVASADRGFLMLADDGELVFRTGRRIDRSELAGADAVISRSVAEEVFRTGRPILSSNVLGDDALRNRRSVLELQLQTVMCAPLEVKERPLGVLYVDSFHLRSAFDAASLTVFQALADLAAIALENARLYELATTDPKTGLANSGFLRARLEEAVHDRPADAAVGLVLVDLDHFKRVNDGHGHPAGDRVLIEVASILRGTVRTGDVAARFGGEEFALLVRPDGERDPDDLVAIGERVRERIAAHRFVLADGTELRVTASVGVARIPAAGIDDADALVEAADRCLYAAKRGGRDRVVTA